MSVDYDALARLRERDITHTREFTVEPHHTTTVFGEQTDPAGKPAAADATPEESVRVLGSPFVVSFAEFTGRESLHGLLPAGTGTVGEYVGLNHLSAAPVGATVTVETRLTDVDGPKLFLDATVSSAGRVLGEVDLVFRVVDRERFRASL
jgi:fluoroacetyl-CoA thioesterase